MAKIHRANYNKDGAACGSKYVHTITTDIALVECHLCKPALQDRHLIKNSDVYFIMRTFDRATATWKKTRVHYERVEEDIT